MNKLDKVLMLGMRGGKRDLLKCGLRICDLESEVLALRAELLERADMLDRAVHLMNSFDECAGPYWDGNGRPCWWNSLDLKLEDS